MDIVLIVQEQLIWDSAASLDIVNYRHNTVDLKHWRIVAYFLAIMSLHHNQKEDKKQQFTDLRLARPI